MTIPIALQLYTVRELLAKDFVGIIEKVADIGYDGIETAFFSDNITLADAAQLFRDLSLPVVAAHVELPLGDQQASVLELAATMGCQRIVWHGWPQSQGYDSIEGTIALAQQYNKANAVAKANGLSFGIHNHWWEFETVEGRYRYQILLEHMDSDIFFEVDTYWVKTAGLDPVDVIATLGARAALLHIKDGPARKDAPMVAAGQGRMDFPAILQAAGSAPAWLIVEMDECATDMMAAVEASYQYLRQIQA